MLEQLKQLVADKKILILGFGREGKSTLQRLLQVGGYVSLSIADQAKISLEDPSISILSGSSYMDSLDDYDIVFKSPGIVLPKTPEEYHCKISSQMEIFFLAYREQIVGITGTKGKSTTTTLLYHILKESGRDCVLAGNIGIPVFDILEQVHKETLIICELSCHQLEYLKISPHWAILLNIYEEHLDHYGTLEKYVRSKHQIYLHQQAHDMLFCYTEVLPEEHSCQANIISISDKEETATVQLKDSTIYYQNKQYQIPTEEISLFGQHNYFDIAFDYAICQNFNISDADFEKALKSYEPLPHRLRFIGEKQQVRYYDDSISTIGETTIQALKSIPNVGSVLIGGMERGIDYQDLIEFLDTDTVSYIILMEATGKRIFEEIQKNYPHFSHTERLLLVKDLTEAVALAKKVTPAKSACVLSPAAASYGIFKNFEERGDVFIQLVLESNESS